MNFPTNFYHFIIGNITFFFRKLDKN